MLRPAVLLFNRDLRLALADGAATGTAIGFYLLVIALLPLGLGPDLKLLARIAPGVLWVALLLSALLSIGRLFDSDFDDGALDLLRLSDCPLELLVIAKIIAHFLATTLPLIIAAPLLGLLLNFDIALAGALIATMLAGAPAISAIGAIGAALTLRARRGGLLIAVLILPLYVPTLVFGVSALSNTAVTGVALSGALFMLLGLSLLALVLAPFAAAAALRLQTG
ncbi:MAG: heme exporter protein CcmB [Pseudomonadota bacterium]